MIKISRKFLEGVKLGGRPAYKIAQEAGLHPAQLSKLITGYDKLYPHDRRVLAVGKVLGLDPSECFETTKKRKGKTLLTK